MRIVMAIMTERANVSLRCTTTMEPMPKRAQMRTAKPDQTLQMVYSLVAVGITTSGTARQESSVGEAAEGSQAGFEQCTGTTEEGQRQEFAQWNITTATSTLVAQANSSISDSF